ncbi:DUF3472 domain-containing protein [Pseudomonas sp. R1-6]|uniref:DUF3472 domain-containing protein n=1 Tax=Pseudomonas sp. R1-6 TaxID=2817397 RepID=UPI003DA976E4
MKPSSTQISNNFLCSGSEWRMAIILRVAFGLLFSMSLFFQSNVQAAVVAGGMAKIDRNFMSTTNGYNDIEFSITITKEPGFNGHTYWGHRFFFKNGEGGHMGLQARTANERLLIFSVSKATGWKHTTASNCVFISHEGNGVQCWITYPWKAGVNYKLRVSATAPDQWSATITDTSSGVSTAVATIEVPVQWNGLSEQVTDFLEDYAQGAQARPSCQSVPSTSALFYPPRANSGTVAPLGSTPTTYGLCQGIAYSSCSNDGVCTASANHASSPEPVVSKKVMEVIGSRCMSSVWTLNFVPKNGDGNIPRAEGNIKYDVSDTDYAPLVTLPTEACKGVKIVLSSRTQKTVKLLLGNTNAGKDSIMLLNGDQFEFVFDPAIQKWKASKLPVR